MFSFIGLTKLLVWVGGRN